MTGQPHIVGVSAGGDNATIAIFHLVLVESRILGTGANCTGLWFRERWFEPDIAPPNIGEWFGNSDSLRFWGCENIVGGGKLFGVYGAVLMLFRMKLLVAPPLLCLGVRYLVSNLVKVVTILEMKFLSLFFFIALTVAFVLSSIMSDMRGGIVLDSEVGPELDNAKDALDL